MLLKDRTSHGGRPGEVFRHAPDPMPLNSSEIVMVTRDIAEVDDTILFRSL